MCEELRKPRKVLKMDTKHIDLKNSVCRACLEVGANKNIFSIDKATSLSYLNIFSLCTSIEINTEDRLPKQICHTCLNTVLSFYIFKSKVVENDLRLKQILNAQSEVNDIKLENNTTKLSKCGLGSRNTSKEINTKSKNVEGVIVKGLDSNTTLEPLDLECDEKNSDFEQETELKDQYLINRIDSCQCNVCGKILSKKSLKLHYQKHSGERPYGCDMCGKKFLRSEHLVDHKRTHTGEKPYHCAVCLKSFKQVSALKAHQRIHDDEHPFICDVCGKSFKHTNSLRRHKEVHSSDTPYTCTVCQKSYKSIGYLRVHMSFHSDRKPFSCKTCDKTYFTKSHLNVHLKTHNNIISVKCVICGKGFVRPQHLKLHLITHTGEKAHSCKLCPKKFSQQSHLNRHMKIHERIK